MKRTRKRIFKSMSAVILCLAVSLSSVLYVCADEKSEPSAKSSILMCMNTGDVIKENNAYEHLSPASVTKIMSILLFLEAIDSRKIGLDDMVTASENAVSKGGSQIWLELGEKMSVNDLMKAVVISSANDACTLLSEYVAGSAPAFVDMMNEKAEALGLENTHFENCTGLDDEITNHYSCAYDLAVIACEVMKHTRVTDYSTVWLDSLRNGKTELNNTNKLINKYEGMTGLKTGTTSNAGFCLCAAAERDGLKLVSVVLGADTSDDRFDLTTQLLDYGFGAYKIEKIHPDKNKIKSVKIKNGVSKSVTPVTAGSSEVLAEKNSEKLTYRYKMKEKVSAPVKKGDKLGAVYVYSGKNKIAEIPLVSNKNVKKVSFLFIFRKMLNNI